MLHHNSTEYFTNLQLVPNERHAILMEQAALLADATTATVMHMGTDAQTAEAAAAAYAQYAREQNESREADGTQLHVYAHPEAWGRKAHDTLLRGGALVRLTMEGPDSSFWNSYRTLQALAKAEFGE